MDGRELIFFYFELLADVKDKNGKNVVIVLVEITYQVVYIREMNTGAVLARAK